MPRSSAKPSRPSKARDYDAESGMNRVTRKKGKKPVPPPELSSESEVTASDSEVESEYEIKIVDPQRQKSLPSRPRKVKAQQDTKNETKGSEPAEVKLDIAPEMSFLVALAYRQGASAVQFDAQSFYIPDCSSLFQVTFDICQLLTPNSLVHEMDTGFTSIQFYLYVGHLYFYHILRVRSVCGELTREERRCLRHYENIGSAEAWPVPTPLVGILQSYGCVNPPSKFYGKIIPKLPSFTTFVEGRSLHGIDTADSITRVPIIPALQEFVYNFGANIAEFDEQDGLLYPLQSKALSPGAAGPPVVPANYFLGLSDSSATGSSQVLFLNNGWIKPAETSVEIINHPYSLKRALTFRSEIPQIGNTATITGIESFLGFREGESHAWMRLMLKSGSTISKFFPNSTNLSAIGTSTQEEFISPIHWSSVIRLTEPNRWYYNRNLRHYTISGRVNTERSGTLYKAAASTAPNSTFDPTIHSVRIPARCIDVARTGPYFTNPRNTISVPLVLVEIVDQPDPLRNALSFIDEHLYDNLGGRARK